MKKALQCLLIALPLGACAGTPSTSGTIAVTPPPQECVGDTALPEALAGLVEPVKDEALLQQALGKPNEGKLCQGQVYQLKQGAQVSVYRAWNSTNPGSELGSWWAAHQPVGPVAQYRADYEICYQWSPLDKLTHCTLQPGTKLVVGTGQSAFCSKYLSYPASAAKQIYIDIPKQDAESVVTDCRSYDGEFSWKPAH